MTDVELLDSKIKQSGLTIKYIVSKLGISRTSFYKKKNGEWPFNQYEIERLCKVLNITTLKEKESIFFKH